MLFKSSSHLRNQASLISQQKPLKLRYYQTEQTVNNWQQSLRITSFLFIAKFKNFLAVDWIVQVAKMPSLLPFSGIFTCIYDLAEKGRSHCK